MKTVLILANSSGGLYDFRNELVLELLKNYKVVVSVPDQTAVEKLAVGFNHGGTNPGAFLVHSVDIGTGVNHLGKGPIYGVVVGGVAEKTSESLWYMELLGKKHESWIR